MSAEEAISALGLTREEMSLPATRVSVNQLLKAYRFADGAANYAKAAVVVAVDAIDLAEQASLEAWLARRNAEAAEVKKASAA